MYVFVYHDFISSASVVENFSLVEGIVNVMSRVQLTQLATCPS